MKTYIVKVLSGSFVLLSTLNSAFSENSNSRPKVESYSEGEVWIMGIWRRSLTGLYYLVVLSKQIDLSEN